MPTLVLFLSLPVKLNHSILSWTTSEGVVSWVLLSPLTSLPQTVRNFNNIQFRFLWDQFQVHPLSAPQTPPPPPSCFVSARAQAHTLINSNCALTCPSIVKPPFKSFMFKYCQTPIFKLQARVMLSPPFWNQLIDPCHVTPQLSNYRPMWCPKKISHFKNSHQRM